MKKALIVGAVLIVVLLVLGISGYAYAQSQNPSNPVAPFGRGLMGSWGRGRMGGGMMGGGMMRGAWGGSNAYGPMHDVMVKALADKIGLTTDEVQKRLDNGESLWQIAQSKGLSDQDIRQLMLDTHDATLAQAVTDGRITQEQADWMDQHMEQMWQSGGQSFNGMPCWGGFQGR